MKSGLIGRVRGDFDAIDDAQFPQVRHKRGNQLRSTISIDENTENISGTPIITGTAAEQIQSEIDIPLLMNRDE
ncbi:hypothetical protein [Natronococcus wangiae]|uniref:hypothetical protein n=1 Tax=Natronococcus wangiae TaxID=3068275 RepID=UPI00273EF559|nr:hypothetical protein [Natronococcus sp. AD5]